MDFDLTPELQSLQQRTRRFIAEEVMPFEADPRATPQGPSEGLRAELVELARRAELLALTIPRELGGRGLDQRGRAVVFEEAGYSPLGPLAMNIAAPDEGNLHLLEDLATLEQRKRWLVPLAAGRIRSCLCFTEPDPGEGSDVELLATTARQDGNQYRIDGLKWRTAGAGGGSFALILARHLDGPYIGQASLFLADMFQPAVRLERSVDAPEIGLYGGHGLVRFHGLRVSSRDVLGEPGQGLRHARRRLASARLADCMRWLGQARRAHDVALAYAGRRRAFGKPLAEHEGVSFMLADNAMDLHAARLAIWHCAWAIDQGEEPGKLSTTVANIIASEATWRVADRCVQVLGGQGVTHETVVAGIFADMRTPRVYDGPSDVHRWSLAKHIVQEARRAA